MRCLDMCAAPGSKTGQIIEALGIDPGDDGLVVANDIDEKRCYMLVHQSGRFGSPKCMVTNHEAQHFPQPPFLFDRVLADVPCSGDGTLRKNPDLWGKWTPALGFGLHRLQLAIALRGIRLTAVGGRFVYSTCSLNPVEDEAVVLELLRRTKGAVRLLDMSSSLVGLKVRNCSCGVLLPCSLPSTRYSCDIDYDETSISEPDLPPCSVRQE
jgi:16S rRNA C967 or C1407 C5-methylase (RsmB/RsmF family)